MRRGGHASELDCYDPAWEQEFKTTTRIEGLTTEVSCYGRDGDLRVQIAPHTDKEDRYHKVSFRLRSYTGPGRYALTNNPDESANIGLEIVGRTDRPDGRGNDDQVIGTNACFPSACEAVVAEGSDPIPNDPMTVQEFRVRVEVHCEAGSKLYDMHCDERHVTACTFPTTPTLRFDVACRH